MKGMTFLVLSLALGLMLCAPAGAGEMTAGMQIRGGENPLSTFDLNRIQDREADVLRLRLGLKDAEGVKGYGLVLHFDPARYTFIEARQATDNALDTGDGPPKLFLAVNNTPGQVALGAMKVDGAVGQGNGSLVELAFRVHGSPARSDFQISDGMLVDANGGLDAVNRLAVASLDAPPASFALDQNTPNPFNPSTTIAFQLPQAGQVRLAVYNALGQEVQVLVNDFREAGHYTAVWNGKDAGGRQVASGIYFYRLEGQGFTQTRRMMLLK